MGNRSLLLVAACMAFFGMMMVEHAHYQATRVVGELSRVGPMMFQLLVREFAPTFTALLVVARAGAGVAAELSAMAVTEQVDALRMSGVDEVEELVAPRVLAGVLVTLALSVVGLAASAGAAAAAATYLHSSDGAAFYDTRFTHTRDLLSGALKAALDGALIPFLSARAGLRARGGSAAVGGAVTEAVVTASLAVIAVDLVVGLATMVRS